jgi:hypothetical protein
MRRPLCPSRECWPLFHFDDVFVTTIFSGSGGVKPTRIVRTVPRASRYRAQLNGFVGCRASPQELQCDLIDTFNNVLHSFSVAPRVKPAPTVPENCYPSYLILKETDTNFLPRLRLVNQPQSEETIVIG